MLSVQALLEAKDHDLNWKSVRWLKWESDPAFYCPLAGIGCVYKNHFADVDCGSITGVVRPARWWGRGLPKDKLRNCTPDQYEALLKDLGAIGITWLSLSDLEIVSEWTWTWNPGKAYKDFVPVERAITSMRRLHKTHLDVRVVIGFKEVE